MKQVNKHIPNFKLTAKSKVEGEEITFRLNDLIFSNLGPEFPDNNVFSCEQFLCEFRYPLSAEGMPWESKKKEILTNIATQYFKQYFLQNPSYKYKNPVSTDNYVFERIEGTSDLKISLEAKVLQYKLIDSFC